MSTVELIYDRDCPNVEKTRAHLLRAFADAGLAPRWSEWDRGDPASPDHVRGYGSPTILVDGKDIAGAVFSEDISCCRVYSDASGVLDGVPPVRMIAGALQTENSGAVLGSTPKAFAGWRSSLSTAPGIALAFLPKLACPACWPAYAGILSSLGLGFLLDTEYLFVLTLAFLLIAVGALAFRAKARRGYGPFTVGVVASIIVLAGKFVFDSTPAMYCGIAMLVAASLWNGWPRKIPAQESCPACAPGPPESNEMETRDTATKEAAT